jgi:hypothetical protein
VYCIDSPAAARIVTESHLSLAYNMPCKCKDYNLQKCTFDCCFVWVRTLVSNIKGSK